MLKRCVVSLCLLVSLVYGQGTIASCDTFHTAEACATSTGRCNWAQGRACDGTLFGWCRANVPCAPVITCAVNASINNPSAGSPPKPFVFTDTCIPPRWISVNNSHCECNRPECSPACTNCSVCSAGQCVSANSFRCLPNSSDLTRTCPPNSHCVTDNCRSVCVPDCTDNRATVQCLVDPCITARPAACPDAAICVADYCGGCNRHFYDPTTGQEVCNECSPADCGTTVPTTSVVCPDSSVASYTGRCIRSPAGTCVWEHRECPSGCNPIRCDIYCQYGNENDTHGCPTCSCRNPPVCTVACTQIACPQASTVAILPGECCPHCINPCDGAVCPAIACPDYTEPRVLDGTCCPICYPRPNCTRATNCVNSATCPVGFHRIFRDCCWICERAVDCSAVMCPDLVCPVGTKKIIQSGECCPECDGIPDCSAVDCLAQCPSPSALVSHDLDCCQRCQPVNVCDTVLCALPQCRNDSWVIRRGECCPHCFQCVDDPSGRAVCDSNDDPHCRPGYFTGTNCTDVVPPTDRVERIITGRFCRRGSCDDLSPQELRLLIARLSNVDARFIFVERQGRDGTDACCVIYRIRINAAVGDGRNVDQDNTAVANAIAASPDFSQTSPTGTSEVVGTSSPVSGASTGAVEANSASSVVLSGIVALLCALLAL